MKLPNNQANADRVEDVIRAYDALMHRFAAHRAPELLETSISMAQMKALFIVVADGELHMSAMTAQLGVSVSTVSGLVDRLVDHGYVSRRDDLADRRQVVVSATPAGQALIDRFRELGAAQLRALLERLSAEDLGTVRQAVLILARHADAAPAAADPVVATRKDPS